LALEAASSALALASASAWPEQEQEEEAAVARLQRKPRGWRGEQQWWQRQQGAETSQPILMPRQRIQAEWAAALRRTSSVVNPQQLERPMQVQVSPSSPLQRFQRHCPSIVAAVA
jgi:hypothetical protein